MFSFHIIKRVVPFLFLSFAVMLSNSCSSDDVELPYSEEKILVNNGITNLLLYHNVDVNQSDLKVYYGNREGKDWFGVFDIKTGSLVKEWTGTERIYENDGLSFIGGTFCENVAENTFVLSFYPFGYMGSVVVLKEDGSVRYGFTLQETIRFILNDNRFLLNDRIVDLEGTTIVDHASYSSNEEGGVFVGLQNEHLWFAYNEASDEEFHSFKELKSSQRFEVKRRIDLGYGEFKDVEIKNLFIKDFIKTAWGYAASVPIEGKNFDLLCVNFEDNDIYSSSFNNVSSYVDLQPWFDDNVLLGGLYVVNQKGKKLTTFNEPFYLSAYEDSFFLTSNTGAVIYTGKRLRLRNVQNGVDEWISDIPSLEGMEDNAKYNITLEEKNANIWTFKFSYINYDGSGKTIRFSLDTDNGLIELFTSL